MTSVTNVSQQQVMQPSKDSPPESEGRRRLRVLFTVQPEAGHLHPLLPVATALREAGHEVAFCSSPSFRPEVEAYGFLYFDAGLDFLLSDRSTWTAFPPLPHPSDPAFPAVVARIFADITTERMIPDLLTIAGAWSPDLIVREGMEYGGCVAAERLGLPHASIAGNALHSIDSPNIGYFTGNRLLVAEHMAKHRDAHGLVPDPEVLMPFRHLHLCFMPRRWDPPEAPPARNAHYLRHINLDHSGPGLPSWLDALPDQPTVLVTLGTVFNNTPGVLEAIIGGMRDEQVNLIVGIGHQRDPAEFGPLPDHIRLEPYVAQTQLLPRCDLLITHCGFNSVKEALSEGIPMVGLPIAADQPYAAGRCAALGVARVIDPANRTPEAVREAVREVLRDPSYRANARRFQEEMQALPGPDRTVQLLEELVRTHAGA